MPPDEDSEQAPQFFIGPESRDEPPSDLLEEARRRVRVQDELNKESARLARRLFVALLLVILLTVVIYVVMPRYGLRLPPFVPILAYISIAAGALLTFRDGAGG